MHSITPAACSLGHPYHSALSMSQTMLHLFLIEPCLVPLILTDIPDPKCPSTQHLHVWPLPLFFLLTPVPNTSSAPFHAQEHVFTCKQPQPTKLTKHSTPTLCRRGKHNTLACAGKYPPFFFSFLSHHSLRSSECVIMHPKHVNSKAHFLQMMHASAAQVQCPQKCFKCFGHFDCSTCISLTRVFLRMYIGLLECPWSWLSVNIIYMSIGSLHKKIYGILSRVPTWNIFVWWYPGIVF